MRSLAYQRGGWYATGRFAETLFPIEKMEVTWAEKQPPARWPLRLQKGLGSPRWCRDMAKQEATGHLRMRMSRCMRPKMVDQQIGGRLIGRSSRHFSFIQSLVGKDIDIGFDSARDFGRFPSPKCFSAHSVLYRKSRLFHESGDLRFFVELVVLGAIVV
jgi:hypothetical protein